MSDDNRPLIDFPCRFAIKAMGRADGSLAIEVEAVVRRHAPDVTGEDVSTTASAKGNYVSVTVTINATSREQLDAIYRDLHAHEAVLMTL